jgi:hypothetical protein
MKVRPLLLKDLVKSPVGGKKRRRHRKMNQNERVKSSFYVQAGKKPVINECSDVSSSVSSIGEED